MNARQRIDCGGYEYAGAVPAGKRVKITLSLDRAAGVVSAAIRFARDKESFRTIPMKWSDLDRETEFWTLELTPLAEGLYFYDFELTVGISPGADGSAPEMTRVYLGGARDPEAGGKCQLTAYRLPSPGANKLAGKMIYHIFVDRFFRSGRESVRPGATLDPDWDNGVPQYAKQRGGAVANDVFFGGDLWGIAEKLDYISSLGADYIFLSPIFEAASNHKYDTGNYLAVDPSFGGDESLRHLSREAARRGVGLILDGVFAHSGDDSVYFNKYGRYPGIGAYQSQDSPYYSWYDFSRFPNDYACWWGIPILPKIKSAELSYRRFVCEKVIPKWSAFGAANWRLDVPDELSDEFLDDFRRALDLNSPEGFIIGEVWEDASNKTAYGKRRRYLSSGQLDSVMNYPFRDAVISYLLHGDASFFRRTVEGILWNYPPHAANSQMNFLGTHDTPRIMTVLGGAREDAPNKVLAAERLSPDDRRRALRLTETAFMLIGILPGALSVFYGDEVGMEGHGDPFCRRPFPWGRENARLLGAIRRLGEIRRTHRVFADGDLAIVSIDENFALIERRTRGECVLCAVNRTNEAHTLLASETGTELFSGAVGRKTTVAPLGAAYVAYDRALGADELKWE